MRTTTATESKSKSKHRLFLLICLPVACALLLWGSRAGTYTAARAEESPSPAPAGATLTVAASPAPAPLVTDLTPVDATEVVSAPPAASEYLLPLPVAPPADRIWGHRLEGVIAAMRSGKSTETRDWVLPLLVKALATPMRQAQITGYSSRDADGGGPYTRWGTRTRWGICAADPRYWGPGSVIWMGEPVNQVLVVEDTGGAVKGQHRFDVCTGDNPVSSAKIGRRTANYVPLYVAPPQSRWGTKPANWRPPVPTE